ncbi:hypothetical protein LOK49_Contig248G00001, partial [Camellia lanceoleosa]
MAVQLYGPGLPNPAIAGQFLQCRSRLSPKPLSASTPLPSPSTIQATHLFLVFRLSVEKIQGGMGMGVPIPVIHLMSTKEKTIGLILMLIFITGQSRSPVQWYPGHIAKTEKELKEQLKLMDVVIEVRDARIPMSTSHPQGTMKLNRLTKALAAGVNVKRRAQGLLPRRVRAGIVGYPNVGKSSLINRLLKRPDVSSCSKTRSYKRVEVLGKDGFDLGKDLELLDSP